MQDISNYDQVKSKAIVLTEMFGRYVEAQQKLICKSGEKDRKAQKIRDFDETVKRTSEFEQRLNEWLVHTEASIAQQEIQPSDSAWRLTKVSSMVMKNSSVSRGSSTRSSISIARVEESAKIAELEVEAKVLKQKQALQEKERRLNEDQLKLALEKEELLLKTELAKVQARESIFAQAEAAAIQAETLDNKVSEKVFWKTLNISQENLSRRVTNSKAIKSEVRSSKKIKESPYDYERQKEQLQDVVQRSHITFPQKKRISNGERDETMLREIYDKDHGIFH